MHSAQSLCKFSNNLRTVVLLSPSSSTRSTNNQPGHATERIYKSRLKIIMASSPIKYDLNQ